MKKAIVTGITGQDGAYLAELLLEKGYEVFGTYRRTSARNFWRLRELGIEAHPNLSLFEHDVTDLSSSIRIIEKVSPDEIYNLAAQSFVGVSFDQPNTTAQITAVGPLNILEAIRITNSRAKFYQASTSEMFGLVQHIPQSENTPFYPRSPYGFSKLFAHWATVNYRESFGIFGASGILFNHESPLRGREFVTRKITSTVARIASGSGEVLELGNLEAERDWGFAKEYVEGMWRMLQLEAPKTLVLATGTTTKVREFVRLAFDAAGIEINFSGSNESEEAHDCKTGKLVMRVNPDFYRPAEVDLLIGDAREARELLDFSPKTNVQQLASMMVNADVEKLSMGRSDD